MALNILNNELICPDKYFVCCIYYLLLGRCSITMWQLLTLFIVIRALVRKNGKITFDYVLASVWGSNMAIGKFNSSQSSLGSRLPGQERKPVSLFML
jgi:hypothetical protein